jgi:hypothetical protein
MFLFLFAFPVFPQTGRTEPGSYIGMRLAELIGMQGIPAAVHAARGSEPWQDDVIFEFNEGSFYIFRDRVWKVSVRTAYGISLGDSRAAAKLVFGNIEDRGDHLITALPGHGAWPMALRINLNNAGAVNAIFIYRSDF